MNRRGLSAAFFAVACLGGCAGEPPPIERRIAAHSLVGCPVTDDASLVITPLGDFGGAPAASFAAKEKGAVEMPQDFLGVELKISAEWSGVGYADPPADADVTLWPTGDGCNATVAAIPPNAGGMTVTSFGDGAGLLVAGDASENAAYALALDLTTGKTLPGNGMAEGRAFATATRFGDGALVAGGVDPTDPTDPSGQRAASTAFVFSAGKFENERIELGNRARAHHGATALANGETLLVGGTNEGVVLSNMVAIDPKTRGTRVFGLGVLRDGRRDPVVVRLANDQVLVAGGTDQDGNPVGVLEWFAADGSACAFPACPEPSSSIPPRPDLALVALPAGGALAAGAAPSADVFDVFWITPEGTALPLDPLVRQRRDAKVRIVAASDGSPWAWNGTTWMRFDPWRAKFLPVAEAPLDGPDDDMPSPVEVDPGLFMWLAREPGTGKTLVRGFRHGVRGRLARDTLPLLFADTLHVAPDRPPRSNAISFDLDPTTGGLHLVKPFTLPAPAAVVTDTLYADFDLSAELDLAGVVPDVVVGDFAIGSGFCAWPSTNGASLSVVRRGTNLDIQVGRATASCPGPEGRVGIALRAPQFGESTVRKLTIARH